MTSDAPTIALVGTAYTSWTEVNDEPPEVQRWGLGGAYKILTKVDRYFEVHTRAWNLRRAGKLYFQYLAFLQHGDFPVVMLEVDETIKNSVAFPMQEMCDYFFKGERAYFSSTVAYMLAMAIMERPKEIKLFGIDMASMMEYAHQRAGCEYFIGWARAEGIQVTIPSSSPILKAPIYGQRRDHKVTQDTLMERLGVLQAEEKTIVEQLVSKRAQILECQYWMGQEQGLAATEKIPQGAPVMLARPARNGAEAEKTKVAADNKEA